MKKFEEGIFSDLRNLKPGVDASLEEPKVSFSSLWPVAVRGLRCEKQVGGKRIKKEGGGNNTFYIFYTSSFPPLVTRTKHFAEITSYSRWKKEKKTMFTPLALSVITSPSISFLL